MQLTIDPGSSDPIYEQIRAGLAAAILAGELTPGEALPSIRTLARDLRVSVITTTRAYNELVADGLADSVRGKGVFVRGQAAEELRARALERIETLLAEAAAQARMGGIPAAHLHQILDAQLGGSAEHAAAEHAATREDGER